jgi:hypothetical protein
MITTKLLEIDDEQKLELAKVREAFYYNLRLEILVQGSITASAQDA